MKKFLTVLLVIAVMFTFSFSSAFAAVAPADKLGYDAALAKIEAGYASAVKIAEDAKTEALNKMFPGGKETAKTTGTDKATIYKTAVDTAYTKVLNSMKADLATQYNAMVENLNLAYQAVTANPSANPKYYAIKSDGAYNTPNSTDVDTVVINTGFVYSTTVDTQAYTSLNTAAAYDTAFALGETGAYKNDVAKYSLAQLITDTRAAIALVNENDYSAEAKGALQSDKEKVADAKTAAYNLINKVEGKVETNTTWSDIFVETADGFWAIAGDTDSAKDPSFMDMVEKAYVAPEGEALAGGDLGAVINGLVKVADMPTHDTVLAFAKQTVIGTLSGAINTELNTELSALNNQMVALSLDKNATQAQKDAVTKNIETVKAQAASAIEILTYLVNDVDDFTKLITKSDNSAFAPNLSDFNATNAKVKAANWAYTSNDNDLFANSTIKVWNGTTTKTYQIPVTAATDDIEVQQITDKVADLKDEAELLKATIKINGGSYDAVDAALEKAIDATYKGDLTKTLNGATAEENVLARIYALLGLVKDNRTGAETNGDATVKVNDKTYSTVRTWYNASNYDTAQKKEAKAVVAEAKDAIKAATTVEEANAAFLAAKEKFDAVATVSDKATTQATKAFQDAKKAAEADIDAYVNYKYALLGTDASKYVGKDALQAALKATLTDEVYSVEELQAAQAVARETVDTLKSNEAISAEKKAINDKINALPKDAKLADKETVTAIEKEVKAYNKYCTLIGSNDKISVNPYPAKLDAAKKAIMTAEAKAINDALAEIYKDGKVTPEEAAAVEAVRAAVDAYEDEYITAPYNVALVPAAGKSIDNAEQALWTAEIKAVEEMIAKLPADGSDVAAVKAAKAAFDALERTQKLGVVPAMRDKLDDMVKYTALDDEAAKAYVQDLSIKARSVKTAKGVKVTIKADVQELLDNGYTVEYKFYRSTKSNAKFGSPKITKTTNTYLNTSGKKGTRYYYKARLVVKNAKGEVVAITPLSQCLYATRTF